MGKHQLLVQVGKEVRAIRKEQGYAQEEFAIECGLDRSYYGGVERGEKNISLLKLDRLAKGLGRKLKISFE